MRNRVLRFARAVSSALPSIAISHQTPARCTTEPLESRRLLSVNVTTYHYNNAETGANTNETALTLANVNTSSFGKVASMTVDGQIYGQPLIMTGVAMANGQGTHDIVLVTTESDDVYAFDAYGNNPTQGYLWHTSLLQAGETTVPETDYGTTDITPQLGITGTPVINPATDVLYVVGLFKESNATYQQRLYALNISSGTNAIAPVVITASVPGTGYDNVGGVLSFNTFRENQRPALTLANGEVYIGWSSHGDEDPWHGWVIAYNATTLHQDYAYCDTANGNEGGIWMSGGGIAVNAAGDLYFTTGNGSFDANTGQGDYGMALEELSPSLQPLDYFSPYNQGALSDADLDYGCGNVILLTGQTGSAPNEALTVGKWGTIYLNNSTTGDLGEYNADGTGPNDDLGEATLVGANTAASNVHNTMVYWNGTVYLGGDTLTLQAFPVANGTLGTTPSSQTSHIFGTAQTDGQGAGLTVSSNGSSNGIVWALDNSGFLHSPAVLYAYNASNLGDLLWSSNQAANNRDACGIGIKFQDPVVANGFVYVAGDGALTVYGLINPTTVPNAPLLSGSAISGNSIILNWTDSSAAPNNAATYSVEQLINGTWTVVNTAPGNSTSLAIGGLTALTTYSFRIRGINSVGDSAYSNVISVMTSNPTVGINFSSGFAGAGTQLTSNGSTTTSGNIIELTNGGAQEAGSLFSDTEMNIDQFSSQFEFQFSSGSNIADGMTFCIQSNAPTALGGVGGGLGYAGDGNTATAAIKNSIAIKFDVFNNQGEGVDSTGLYQDAASPTVPATDLTSSGVNLHSGDIFQVNLAYNGTVLTETILDTNTGAEFSQGYNISIPADTGNTAYVGFTAGSGGVTNVASLLNWTFTSAVPPAPTGLSATATTNGIALSWNAPAGAATFDVYRGSVSGGESTIPIATGITAPTYLDTTAVAGASYFYYVTALNGNAQSAASSEATATALPTPTTTVLNFANGFANASSQLTLNGNAALTGSTLTLTNGGMNQASSVFASTPINPANFSTSFQFQVSAGAVTADGFTFCIQGNGPTALGNLGGGLGYGTDGQVTGASIANSVAIKFDLYNNAGEGSDSTGLYLNGASPTLPAADMTSSGINLHSGDVFTVSLTYNGSTLTETITDAVTNASFTENYSVNIPAATGNTAYAGFTAGTGGLASTQQILNWTFNLAPTVLPAAPTALAGMATSGSSISLSWTNNTSNQSGFILDRATNATFTQNLVTQSLPAAPSSFTDTSAGLSPGTIYYYRIRVITTAGTSVSSATAMVAIPSTPAAATNAAVTSVTAGTIALSWTDNAGSVATGYTILRATNHGSFSIYQTLPASTLTALSVYTWTDTGVSPGTFYDYQIECYNIAGYTGYTEATATTLTLAPTGLTAIANSSGISLSWTAPAGAVAYNIYRGTTAGGEGAAAIATGITSTSYLDATGLSPGQTYYYKVTATNGNAAPVNGESSRSNEASATSPLALPAAPTNLSGAAASASSIAISWTTNTPNAKGFSLDRATNASFTQNLVTQALPATPNSFTDVSTGLAAGGTYYYRIREITSAGSSVSSSAAIVSIPALPAAPSNLSVGTVTTGSASLRWTDNAGSTATGYKVLRSVSGGAYAAYQTLPAASASAPSIYTWTDTAVAAGTLYGYQIETYNLSGVSSSLQVAAATLTTAPSGLTAVAANGQINLSWTAPAGAVSFNVYRGTAAGGESAVPIATGLSTASYSDFAIAISTQYFYYVTASNGNTAPLASLSAASNEASTTSLASVAVIKLTGTPIGVGGNYSANSTYAAAFDGSFTTYFDPANGTLADYVGLDLGSPQVITQIKYAPRSSYEYRMYGGQFQASNSANFSSGVVTLYTVGAIPTAGQFTTVAVNPTGAAYRYIRYTGGTQWVNIAEMEVDGLAASPAVKLTGTAIGVGGNFNASSTYAAAFDGSFTTGYEPATSTLTNYVGLDLGTAETITQIQFAPLAGFESRMVGGSFQVSNSANFSTGVVNLYTIATAPVAGHFTIANVISGGSYRYIRYTGGTGWVTIAEMEVDGIPSSTVMKLTGTPIGVGGAYVPASGYAAAFDGDLTTSFDPATSNLTNWVGLDLGSAQTITQIKFAPRAGYEFRMYGGQFQVSNTADFSSGVVTVYTVSAIPVSGQLTAFAVSLPGTYRYVRFVGGTQWVNIAEMEVDGL
jgi:fibronectin type 3 domain-containing protein